MHTERDPRYAAPVHEARAAIWRLFEEGYVDADMATASLLAVDLGTRRKQLSARERQQRASRGRPEGRRAA